MNSNVTDLNCTSESHSVHSFVKMTSWSVIYWPDGAVNITTTNTKTHHRTLHLFVTLQLYSQKKKTLCCGLTLLESNIKILIQNRRLACISVSKAYASINSALFSDVIARKTK